MGLSSTACEIDGDFGRNLLEIFPANSCALNAQAEGLPLKFCNGDSAEKNYTRWSKKSLTMYTFL